MRKSAAAIVLAAGQGKRMKSKVQKQYLLIDEKPVLYYSLEAFQKCSDIDEIILVTGEDEIAYCKAEFADKYSFTKITQVVAGGKERYHSVYEGLKAITDKDYVFIHDGARPFVTEEIIKRSLEAVKEHGACVVGMPIKDTVKVADKDGFVESTPDRNFIWQIQTPQVFSFSIVKKAYDTFFEQENQNATDDAMVVETMLGKKVKLVQGSYENLKITTPEDLRIAQSFVEKSNI